MKTLTQAELTALRNQYPKGTRIKLIYMDDLLAPEPGTCGTVTHVDDLGNILMRWDNGGSLALLPGVDNFVKL